MKFGRDAERQSDDLGVEYSSKIGYDAQEMAGFFNTLERKNTAPEGAEELPDFLSTHPNPGDRNVAVNNLSVEWKKKLNLTNPQVNRDNYLRMIDGLIYGEDPKQGFRENDVFYHPELKFQFPIPPNWNYQNTPRQVSMAPKDGKALMIFTIAPGSSLQEAANTFVQQNNLQVLESSQTTVNGLNAIAMVADVKPQQQQQQQQQQQGSQVRTMSYLIQFGSSIYLIMGASSANDFNNYSNYFTQTMKNFRELRDASKLNRKPERVRIKSVKQTGTLQQSLASYKVVSARQEEMAVLNGMKLTDRLQQGSLIKVIEF